MAKTYSNKRTTVNTTIQDQNTDTHVFDTINIINERRTLYVIILTAVAMVFEITMGIYTNSMALLANGWHMGTHFFALGITYFTYIMARHFAERKLFTFGTGKFGILSAYTSSLLLGVSAIFMIYESIERFSSPVNIAYNEAIVAAIIALVINIISIMMLNGTGLSHNHGYEHKRHNQDQNLRAAYMHIVADILISVLAIIALTLGKFLDWPFLDPLMGIIGGIFIAKWAYVLLVNNGFILLDGNQDKSLYEAVSQAIEADGDSSISDLHIWPLNEKAFAGAIIINTKKEYGPEEYRERLTAIKTLKHITIEIHYVNTHAESELLPDKL